MSAQSAGAVSVSGQEHGWFGHPHGLSTLYFTELWERFSYYGMRALLMLFMVAPESAGGLGFAVPRAGIVYGTYTMSVYLLSIIGGFLGDRFLGARRAVRIATLVIVAGHFTLAFHSLATFYAGLALVALGSGLLKPNMSTLVGELYAPDDPRRDAGFSIFYMGINVGAFAAPLITGFLAQSEAWKQLLVSFGFDPLGSWRWGFAAAGLGMAAGILWLRATEHRIAHIGNPPDPSAPRPWLSLAGVSAGSAALFCYVLWSDQPGWEWLRSAFVIAPVALAIALALRQSAAAKHMAVVLVFCLAAMLFWAVFEQQGSTLALFGENLTRHEVFGWSFPSAWYQSIGAIFVVVLAPVFAWGWTRLGDRQPSSPVKFALGLTFLAASFALMIPAARLSASGAVSAWWLVGLFFLQTLGELCLSPVGLSAISRLAPAKFAGLVMGVWFLASALGNKLAGVFAGEFTPGDPARLARFFETQTLAIAVAAVLLFALAPKLKRLMSGAR